MTNYEKPTITDINKLESEQVFAKKSGGNGNNGRFGSGNSNSHNGGSGIGAWEGGKNHDKGNGRNKP